MRHHILSVMEGLCTAALYGTQMGRCCGLGVWVWGMGVGHGCGALVWGTGVGHGVGAQVWLQSHHGSRRGGDTMS